jgi:hypothetical protein
MPGLTEHVVQAARELGAGLDYDPPSSAILVSGEDRERVIRLLDSHPLLHGRARPTEAFAGAASNEARRIDTDVDASPGSMLQLTWTGLLGDPVAECDRILAALGEADAEPLVRHLVTAYLS